MIRLRTQAEVAPTRGGPCPLARSRLALLRPRRLVTEAVAVRLDRLAAASAPEQLVGVPAALLNQLGDEGLQRPDRYDLRSLRKRPAGASSPSGRFLAATTRRSSRWVRFSPSLRISPSWSTRSSLACARGVSSATSSSRILRRIRRIRKDRRGEAYIAHVTASSAVQEIDVSQYLS